MRSLDKRVNHFKQTNEIIWFKGNFGNFEIKENFRRFNAPKVRRTCSRGKKGEKGRKEKGKKGERKERKERKVRAKWRGEFFLLLQAFQVLYK